MDKYDHNKIEKKWQKKWASNKIYRSKEDDKKDKYYILDMFPYPSGDGLHVGHPKGYIATDVVSRYRRMNGYSVLHPMGFDAFGLPAENYAIKTKTNPADAVAKNVKRFKKQLELLGLDYDWSREINTTDPKYYKWTQWIFLQLLKKGLAYESYEPINWCPSCKTGLANEDIENGKCERCGTMVEKKAMRQWVLRITDYAERLLSDLDARGTYEMPKVVDKANPHQDDKPIVSRNVAHAIVFDPKNKKYLIIRNKKHGWDTVIIGGIEGCENAVDTARREVIEETGYTDLEFKRILGGPTEARYYAKHKGENRIAIAQAVYFELKSDKKIARKDDEDPDDEVLWIDEKDFVPGKMVNSELPIWLERLKDESKGHNVELLDWPNSIKELQKNWIGKSEGAVIEFLLEYDSDKKISEKVEVFTTRPDTLFGVTYIVLSPEHEIVKSLLNHIANKSEAEKYIADSKNKTEIERTDAKKDKTGVQLQGVFAINPANNEKVPVWISDYVLADYGTGAVMAVPAHDERDWEFAKKFDLPIKQVITTFEAESGNQDVAFTGEGKLMNSDVFDDHNSAEAKREIVKFVNGKWVTKYKLRDWVFSRQRYWGEPIPVIHCEKCGVVPVPEKDLPVILPKVKSYEPTGTGESPLAGIAKWVNVKCPNCKGKAKRETNTMPQWAGSCWYYLRYMDTKNKKALVDPKKEKYWAPVDLYVGGAEHATRHLIYARFWHKFLYDIGVVSTIEPFLKLQHVGLIMGEDGRKMSKRFGNVINPDDLVATYGADTLRVYEMFMGPFDQQITWNTNSMIGSRRFIERIWKMKDMMKPVAENENLPLINRTIKKVTEDIEGLRFNTAISSIMILVNEFENSGLVSKSSYEILLKLIAPFAPHITEELWNNIGNKKSINISEWPKYDASKLDDNEVSIAVQINGKVRSILKSAPNQDDEQIKRDVMKISDLEKWIKGKEIKKVIVVKNKLVNIVVA